MNKRHSRTLQAVFKTPTQCVNWSDCENLLLYLGAEVSEGNGSRLRVELNGVKAVFHRPHPRKETDKGALVSLRKFLINAGVQPDKEGVK